MKKAIAALIFLAFLIPSEGSRVSQRASTIAFEAKPLPSPLHALESFKTKIRERGETLENQGILIETLDGKQTLASENADSLFNPASVMKLATTLVALSKLGPDYRYQTDVLADGRIDRATRRLDGDLVIRGSADPMFSLADAQDMAGEILRLGVAHVSGALRIAGPFYYFATGYHSNLSPETSAEKLRNVLQRRGISIEGPTVFGLSSGQVLVSHYSDRLRRILFYQNAHSSNAVAEVVGVSVGGRETIQDFLIREVGLSSREIYVGRPSGLEFNRITPRACLRMLRRLISVLSDCSLKPEDVMAVAGIDSGTLGSRLGSDGIRGSVIAKTGTLISIDNGVSTLVGIAHTRAQGPLLFAIFDSGGGVKGYRRSQDEFLTELITEKGGGVQCSRTEDALAVNERDSFTIPVNSSAELQR